MNHDKLTKEAWKIIKDDKLEADPNIKILRQIHDQFAGTDSSFLKSDLQGAITVYLHHWLSGNGTVCAQIKAGFGKTWIILQLASLLRYHEKQVRIVLVTDLLYMQFQNDNLVLNPNNPFEISLLQDLTPDDCRGKYVIVDEVDDAIDKGFGLVDKQRKHALGMLSLKYAAKVCMLSASYDSFHKSFLRLCFDQSFIKQFRGIQEIISDIAPHEVQKPIKSFKTE